MLSTVDFQNLRNSIEYTPEEAQLSEELKGLEKKRLSQFLNLFLSDEAYIRKHPPLCLRLLRVLPALSSKEVMRLYKTFGRVHRSLDFGKEAISIPVTHNPNLLSSFTEAMAEQFTLSHPEKSGKLAYLNGLYNMECREAAEKLLQDPSLIGYEDQAGNDLLDIVLKLGPLSHILLTVKLYKNAGHPVEERVKSWGREQLKKSLCSEPEKFAETVSFLRANGFEPEESLRANNYSLVRRCESLEILKAVLKLFPDEEEQRKILYQAAPTLIMYRTEGEELRTFFKFLKERGIDLQHLLTRRNHDSLTPLDHACLDGPRKKAEIILEYLDDKTLWEILTTPNHGFRTTLSHCTYYFKEGSSDCCSALIKKEFNRLSKIYGPPPAGCSVQELNAKLEQGKNFALPE